MTRAHLVACPSCARHVRVSERTCPFCEGVLDDAFRSRPAPRPPASRLSRAALYAFGAGTLTLATACGGSTSDENPDAAPIVDAAYGGPPRDGGGDADAQPGALYGAPPFDASADAQPVVDAAYGGPPIDASSDAQPDAQGHAAYGGPPIDAAADVQGGALYSSAPHGI